LDVLRAVRRGAFADRAFERVAPALSPADRRLTQEISYGTLRLRGRLDFVLDDLVKGGVHRLESDVLDILRLAAYQLLELDRLPAYAVVSDAVEASKLAKGPGAGSLTNAVLRRLSRGTYSAYAFPSPADGLQSYLSTWGSHPAWLLERWLSRESTEDVSELVEYNNRRPAVYLSVTAARNEALERLRNAGVEAKPAPWVASSLQVDPSDALKALELVGGVIQDPAAAAVVDFMALDPGSDVVDLCAAPGGKAALLAARGNEVWAFDVAAGRLARLLENRDRLGLDRLHVACGDATRPPVACARTVLIDVPCSGTGTLARHPDSRWRLQPDDLAKLVELQGRIVDAAAGIVQPGGLLVYATCSLEPEENQEQVEAFLTRRSDFKLEEPSTSAVAAELTAPDGTLRILPQHHGMDGAYAARLRRAA
jgi:16S rRNA (cytosine967-C5)-methyltransferase